MSATVRHQVPHPFGCRRRMSEPVQGYANQLTTTHLNFLSRLTDEQRWPLSSTRAFFTLIPSIARADRQSRAVRRKGKRGDGDSVALVLTEAFFDLMVPDGDGGV